MYCIPITELHINKHKTIMFTSEEKQRINITNPHMYFIFGVKSLKYSLTVNQKLAIFLQDMNIYPIITINSSLL